MTQSLSKSLFFTIIICFMPMILFASLPAGRNSKSNEINFSKKYFWKNTYESLEQNLERKLTLKEKIALRIIGKKNVKTVSIPKQLNAPKEENWGGFFLGFFLGLLGVLIAYVIDSDTGAAAWRGLGTALLIAIIALVIMAL